MVRAWYKEDDRRGANLCRQADAAGDPGASPGRGPYKNDDTMADEKLYLMDCGNALSCWKAYQRKLYNEARRFDHQLFTRAQIVALGHHLDNLGRTCRNYVSISMPDFGIEQYGMQPHISIGNGCGVGFIPVRGYYGEKK